jgi:serine protease Do
VRGTLIAGDEDDSGPPADRDAPSDDDHYSIGTGFVINRNGYIVTNEHVIRDVVDLRVKLADGRELKACVVGADTPTDIALLKVEPKTPLPVLPLGDSAQVRVGENAIAIGSPYGFSHSVTAGIVSAKDRVVDRGGPSKPGKPEPYAFFIQTDASINVGNSGGPLIDEAGRVIGVNAAFWSGQPLQPAQGIGFAIPINIAKALLPRLNELGQAPRSFLGVDAQPVDAGLAQAFGLDAPRGALVAHVERDSAAAHAGLESGDVILSWNGAAVATNEDLKISAQLTPPGTRVRVGLVRGGKMLERVVDMQPAPFPPETTPPPASCKLTHESVRPTLSLQVSDLPVQRAATLPDGRGVLVQEVTRGSLAAEAGLRAGDILLRVGATPIGHAEELQPALEAYQRGEAIPLLVRRSGYNFWTTVPRP